jgi:hypothetical protein
VRELRIIVKEKVLVTVNIMMKELKEIKMWMIR